MVLLQSWPRMMYLGAILFFILLALAVYQARKDWEAEAQNSKADAFYEMVRNTIPNRPTDTPGAIAWLHRELKIYFDKNPDTDPRVTQWQDCRTMPDEFRILSDPLVIPPTDQPVETLYLSRKPVESPTGGEPVFRNSFYINWGEEQFVVTRRKTLGDDVADSNQPSNEFLHRSLPHLVSIRDQIRPQNADAYHVTRVYSLCEDGMLTLLPLPSHTDAGTADSGERLRQEGRAMLEMPKTPDFVSNAFFFVFDFDQDQEPCPFFSGVYLDLGGQGLVASIIAPFNTPQGSLQGVLGMDIVFEPNWDEFAANIDKPTVAAVVDMASVASESGWQPWGALTLASLEKPVEGNLKKALAELARNERDERHFHNPSPIYHGVTAEGALVTFRVAPEKWLVILFPKIHAGFPIVTLAFVFALFLLLLAGFEHNRRNALAAERKAVREFEEKQNLLETMQVPLMVVDPNTENVVYGNRAALELGIQKGRSVKDLLIDDPRVREHYEKMQIVDREKRRAYGLPLVVGKEKETRYAVVRSVAVNAPIEMIHADERHRLGILFLIEPERDLALYTRELVQKTMDEERFRLAGLLDHGVDTLARILERRLRQGDHSDFTTWLSGYIHRRIRLSAWVLNQWDTSYSLPPDCVIEESHARATLQRLDQIFCMVRRDAGLRAQLHWNNGLLSGWQDGDDQPVLNLRTSWTDQYCFTCPVQGGFGLFLGEVLVNAVRHGAPGGRIDVNIKPDAIRRELEFRVNNPVTGGPEPDRPEKKYGGRAILTRLALLFEWRNLTFTHGDDNFRVSWRVPCGERAERCESD